MNHFGCPEVYLDLLHGGFSLFVPLFYSIIYLVTFILNVGYIVEERANKTKVNNNSMNIGRRFRAIHLGIFTYIWSSNMGE